jgi:hypothetical protein
MDEFKLLVGFDCAGSNFTDLRNCFSGFPSELYQQPRGDRSRSPKPPHAMNKNIEPGAQSGAQSLTDLIPHFLELYVRNSSVHDRQMVPVNVPGPNLFAELRHLEPVQLVAFDQGENGCRIPGGHGVQIESEVASPRAC